MIICKIEYIVTKVYNTKIIFHQASTEEIHQLYRLLELRVRNEIERQKQLKNVSRESEPDAKKQAMDDNNSSSSQ